MSAAGGCRLPLSALKSDARSWRLSQTGPKAHAVELGIRVRHFHLRFTTLTSTPLASTALASTALTSALAAAAFTSTSLAAATTLAAS